MTVSSNKDIETVVKSLKANRFDPVEFVEKADTATKLVLDMIPPKATVGVAGSVTVRQIGLAAQLERRGTTVIDTVAPSDLSLDELQRQTLRSDILLTSSNAVTLDGKLVNIDMTGNRVSSMIYGPKRVIVVAGKNKIVSDVDEAIHRIKNVIAPYHARTAGARTPCAVDGYCTDCKSPGRICSVTTIIEKKPRVTDLAVIIVGEDLGLGWDPAWPEERKKKIALAYESEMEKRRAAFRASQQ